MTGRETREQKIAKVIPPTTPTGRYAPFKENADFEQMLKWRDEKPHLFESLSPLTKAALGHYKLDRERHHAMSDASASTTDGLVG
jgi:hypothetical protein